MYMHLANRKKCARDLKLSHTRYIVATLIIISWSHFLTGVSIRQFKMTIPYLRHALIVCFVSNLVCARILIKLKEKIIQPDRFMSKSKLYRSLILRCCVFSNWIYNAVLILKIARFYMYRDPTQNTHKKYDKMRWNLLQLYRPICN